MADVTQEKPNADELTDTQLLDYLDQLSGGYTGRVLLRDSTTGRGWRLHESSKPGASSNVRAAIRQYIKEQGQ